MLDTVETQARNASLADLAALLKDQQAHKVDVVAGAKAIRSRNGLIEVTGTEPTLGPDGVTMTAGLYRPTVVFDEGVAAKLGIPVQYLRRLRADRPDLYDANVNGLLHGRTKHTPSGVETVYPADDRSFFLRCFSGDGDGPGVARALLSDTYKPIDNFDVITAALSGVRESGLNVQVETCNLTDRRMTVRLRAPEIAALAPGLLAGYRSPFGRGAVRAGRLGDAGGGWSVPQALAVAANEGQGYEPGTEPVVFAGLDIGNSEVGNGAFSLTPVVLVQVCKNGLTLNASAIRSVHLGSKMSEGVVRWSDDTQAKNLDLISAKARDAVRTFLDVDFITNAVNALTEKAGTPVSDAAETVKLLGKKLTFDEATTAAVLDHFIMGGQMTAGGIMQAVTSVAQTIEDADKASDVEGKAIDALAFAAALR